MKQASRDLVASLKARLAELDRSCEKEQTKADVEVVILDEVCACLPSPAVTPDKTLDSWHADLEAVAATFKEPGFVLLGLSRDGALAITHAPRHPERVSRIVLVNAYGQGARMRATTASERLEAETPVNFIRIGWGARTRPSASSLPTCLFPTAHPNSTAAGAIRSGALQHRR